MQICERQHANGWMYFYEVIFNQYSRSAPFIKSFLVDLCYLRLLMSSNS